MKALDPLDRKILLELDRNSRQSLSDLARKLHQGRDRVEYRVERFIEQKIIRKFTASVNPYKMGYTLFKSYFRLENRKDRIAEFLAYLQKHPRIYWLALCDGGWDLLVVVFARDVAECHEIYATALSKFDELVLNFTGYVLVEFTSYSRNYLGKGVGIQTGVGGKPENLPLDEHDLGILEILADDARTSTVQIGQRIGVSHHVVRYRIESMERVGIINGYRLELDLNKLNLLFFKTQFFLRSYGSSLRNQFRDYCRKNPHIISYIEQYGDCNVEIELEVEDYQQYAHIIDEIRGEFAKLVRHFQSMLIRVSTSYAVPRSFV